MYASLVSGNREVAVELSSNGRGKIQKVKVRGDNGVSDDREVAVQVD